MNNFARVALILPALALGACATAPVMAPASAPAPAPVNPAQLTAPATTTAVAASMTDVSAFVDAAAFSRMSAKSRTEASSAQFNALQFGRVGAPRNWVGDNGQSGVVTVGPYVRVNLIDCRDFTHTVSIGGQNYVSKGTACREANGSWIVSTTTG